MEQTLETFHFQGTSILRKPCGTRGAKGGPAKDLPTLQIFEAILPAAQSSSRQQAHSKLSFIFLTLPSKHRKPTLDVSKFKDSSFIHFPKNLRGMTGTPKLVPYLLLKVSEPQRCHSTGSNWHTIHDRRTFG